MTDGTGGLSALTGPGGLVKLAEWVEAIFIRLLLAPGVNIGWTRLDGGQIVD